MNEIKQEDEGNISVVSWILQSIYAERYGRHPHRTWMASALAAAYLFLFRRLAHSAPAVSAPANHQLRNIYQLSVKQSSYPSCGWVLMDSGADASRCVA